jgi:hypothetical protein
MSFEDIIGFLFILFVFVLGPIIEAARRKQQQKQPPPPQRERPQSMSRPLPRSRTEELPARTEYQRPRPVEESEPAATMVPEDLWAVLTGQPLPAPPKPRPTPPPTKWEEPADLDFEDLEGEQDIAREDVTVEVRRSRVEEAVSLEELPRRELPTVVSMETDVPDTRTRHAAFHKKFQPLGPAPPLPSAARLIMNARDLRRAILYQTILGPPKGLE